ncbi:MAG: hypothetical protein COU51_03795 [Parcubacteria group bacterium CG10_big_fil_rev_8_21_14_0_10_36_14]|nr:MAG: hypothetical protein COU51_03795 [Parcubacteria group bacterium CG10_big_fil_rev_8_21_14_0_10_36_14]
MIDKLKKYLFNYTFIEELTPGNESFNTNLKLRRNLNKSLWVGKIFRPLSYKIEDFYDKGKHYICNVDFQDLEHRAIFGFRLAKVIGLKSLKFKTIQLNKLSNFDPNTIKHDRINNNVFLTKLKGVSLTQYLSSNSFETFESSDIINKDEAIFSFVFNLWIGNYDNKDEDFLVDEDKNLISIDYQVLGPGFRDNPKLSLGAWGESFDINDPRDTGWCIGDGKLLDYLRNSINRWEIFKKAIEKINSLPEKKIKLAMKGLNFYNQGTKKNINDLFYSFLLERRTKLEKIIKDWIRADCPIVDLPKDNGVK